MKKIVYLLMPLISLPCLFGCNKSNGLSTPLTFTCNKDGGRLSVLHVIGDNGSPHSANFSWKVNGGEMKSYTFDTTEKTTYYRLCENLKAGDKVCVYGDNSDGLSFQEGYGNYGNYCLNTFVTGGEDDFSVSGNIMSLLNKESFAKLKTLPNKGTFASLFASYPNDNTYCCITDASKLLLPAATITENCYDSMFIDASKLKKTPTVLPSKNMPAYCYEYMFQNNSLIVRAPKILGKTTGKACCERMFCNCGSLEQPPTADFSKTTPSDYCFFWMFWGCRSLKQAIRLSDVGIANSCYTEMYSGCGSLHISDKSGIKIFTCPDLSGATGPVDYMFDGFKTLVPGTTYYYVK